MPIWVHCKLLWITVSARKDMLVLSFHNTDGWVSLSIKYILIVFLCTTLLADWSYRFCPQASIATRSTATECFWSGNKQQSSLAWVPPRSCTRAWSAPATRQPQVPILLQEQHCAINSIWYTVYALYIHCVYRVYTQCIYTLYIHWIYYDSPSVPLLSYADRIRSQTEGSSKNCNISWAA